MIIHVYYPCSENKGADKLRGHREADSHMLNVGFLMTRLRHDSDIRHSLPFSNSGARWPSGRASDSGARGWGFSGARWPSGRASDSGERRWGSMPTSTVLSP